MTQTVCNCFSNIKFSDFKVSMIEVLNKDGKPVALLPNGSPSVKLLPIGIYCFGDIEPCSCVTREFILINEGAKEGKYQINLKGICYDIKNSIHTEQCLVLISVKIKDKYSLILVKSMNTANRTKYTNLYTNSILETTKLQQSVVVAAKKV